MTIILAAKCANGLVMAADSQGSEGAGGGIAMKTPAQKIHKLTDHIIWAGSGHVGTIQDVKSALEDLARAKGPEYFQKKQISKLRQELIACVSPVLRAAYGTYVQVPMSRPDPPRASFLFAGVTGPDKYQWLLEIEANGTGQLYSEIGFHAIGSGGDMARLAHGTLLHYALKDRPLVEGQLVVYRMMDAVIESMETVGPPIRMWVLDDGSFREMSESEMQGIKDTVGLWKAVERESLAEVFASSGSGEILTTTPGKGPDGPATELVAAQ